MWASLLVLEHLVLKQAEADRITLSSSYLVLFYLVVRLRRGYNEPRRMYLDGPERVSGERHHHPPCLMLVCPWLGFSLIIAAELSHSESKTFVLTL
jgi:hypothetical protein